MELGIVFCLGIVLTILDSVCWYEEGKSGNITGLAAVLLMALRVISMIFIVTPILIEYGIVLR